MYSLNSKDCSEVLDLFSEGLLIIKNEKIIDCNSSALSVFGFENKKEILNINPFDLSPKIQKDGSFSIDKGEIIIEKVMKKGTLNFKWIHSRKNGEDFLSSVKIVKKNDLLFAVVKDLSKYNGNNTYTYKWEDNLKDIIYNDDLTGLHNRFFIISELENRIINTKDEIGVINVDIDNFKQINDNLGHTFGDEIIKEFSNILNNNLPDDYIVGRLGGDEFIIITSHTSSKKEILEISENLLRLTNIPFDMGNKKLYLSVSIGISLYPYDGLSAESLIKNAHIAMSKAKKNSTNKIEFYKDYMEVEIKEKFKIENNLSNVLKNNELKLNYQPIINLDENRIIGNEALLRWNNRYLGQVSPLRFIPIAEKMGIIIDIGRWVLEEACKQNMLWRDMGFGDLKISVNVSIKQLETDDFIDAVKNILDKTNMPANLLELEITESLYSSETEHIVNILNQLKSLGISISIDDFGSGYSSFSKLTDFEIDKLKIDKRFIQNLTLSAKNQRIVLSILDIAKNLDLEVISEGIENERQLDFLVQNRCDYGQGFFFSKPVPSEVMTNIIKVYNDIE